MRRSKVEIYLHVVWATKARSPWLVGEIERAVHRCIQKEASGLGCEVLGLGGMPDHLHLLVRLPSTVSVGALIKQLKGSSSRIANVQSEPGTGFGWQEGYGVFSVSRPHVERVRTYIQNQPEHHQSGRVCRDWEVEE